jgi:acetyl-CoA carboxylase biotin carboxyl carrier protein
VRISRYAPGAPVAPAPVAAAPAPVAPAPAPAAQAGEPVAKHPEEDGYLVAAPMVGTFYAASSPGAAPYVQVGDRVSEGDTLCIIEAMKMMNQIEADVSGVVKSIRVQNGEPVEYGQTLFVIDQRESD